MKKNFLPCLADPLHEASQHFAYSPAQRKPVPAGRARATAAGNATRNLSETWRPRACALTNGGLTVGQKHFSPLGDDDKGSEGSRRREWAFVSVGVLECNG